MFNFVDVALDNHVEVEPVSRDGTRFYPIPGADKYYPSVTSITSFKNAQFFAAWRSVLVKTRRIELLLEQHNGALPFMHSQKTISKEQWTSTGTWKIIHCLLECFSQQSLR